MTLTATNITLGAGRVWLVPYSAGSLVSLPAATLARNSDWSATVPGWIDLGFTKSATFKYSEERKIVEAQQTTLGVRAFVTKQECELEVELLETTLSNLKYILGHGSLSTSGSTQVLALSANPAIAEYTLGLEFMAPAADVTYAGHLRLSRCVGMPDFEKSPSNEDEDVYKGNWKALDHASGGEFARWQYRYA